MAKEANGKLATIYDALRECGKTSIPMKDGVRMKDVMHSIEKHSKYVQDTNNDLIERLGEDGQVSPESENWREYVEEANALQEIEFDLGAPFVLQQKGSVFKWQDGKSAVTITPNVMADMRSLLVVEFEGVQEEGEVVGHIEPEADDAPQNIGESETE